MLLTHMLKRYAAQVKGLGLGRPRHTESGHFYGSQRRG